MQNQNQDLHIDLEKIVDQTFFWFGKGFYWLIVFLTPIHGMLFVLLLLLLSDYFTGVAASKRRGEIYSSRKARRTVVKGLQYGNFLLLGFLADIGFINDFVISAGRKEEWIFSIILMAVIARIELKSISENYQTLTGKDVWGGLTFYTNKITEFFKRK